MTDVLAAIDAALDDHQATTGQIGEDHYREAMDSVRDLLDGAHGIGNSEMHWAPCTAPAETDDDDAEVPWTAEDAREWASTTPGETPRYVEMFRDWAREHGGTREAVFSAWEANVQRMWPGAGRLCAHRPRTRLWHTWLTRRWGLGPECRRPVVADGRCPEHLPLVVSSVA